MKRFLAALFVALALAGPAQAGPVVGAIGSFFAGIKATLAAGGIGAFLIRTAVSIGLSLLAQAAQKRPRQPGIRTKFTTAGGVTPQPFIIGRYATAGHLVAPPYSHGSRNSLLSYVIAVSVLPVEGLAGLIVDEGYLDFAADTSGHDLEQVALGPEPPPPADEMSPPSPPRKELARFTFHDGTQTAADPYMLDRYGSHPERPWLSDMVGEGLAYMVIEFPFDRELYQAKPRIRPVIDGIKLYDPRKDSTRGGSGAHRLDDPDTWEFSANNMVAAYNVAIGIPLPDGDVYGGEYAPEDLPLANWIAAMNACDAAVDIGDSETEPAYRCGLEVSVDTEPAEVMEQLALACAAQYAEFGGQLRVRVGPVAAPVMTITDADIAVTVEQSHSEFPGLQETFNAVAATYPEPEELWEAKEAPLRVDTDAVEADGARRLASPIQFNAVPYPLQVQRLQSLMLKDHRRFRTHRIRLHPRGAVLEPLDAIEWTSARHGYDAKTFEVAGIEDDPLTGLQWLSLRERDAGDAAWSAGDALPWTVAPTGLTRPPAEVEGFDADPYDFPDADDTARRPAIKLTWDTPPPADAKALRWQVRRDGKAGIVLEGLAPGEPGEAIVTGVLPGEDYEARAIWEVRRPREWSAWTAVTAPGVRIDTIDLADNAVSLSASAFTSAQTGFVSTSFQTAFVQVVGYTVAAESDVDVLCTFDLLVDGDGDLTFKVLRTDDDSPPNLVTVSTYTMTVQGATMETMPVTISAQDSAAAAGNYVYGLLLEIDPDPEVLVNWSNRFMKARVIKR